MTKQETMARAWEFKSEVISAWTRRGVSIDDAEDAFMEAVTRVAGIEKESQIRQSLHQGMAWAIKDAWRKKKRFYGVLDCLTSGEGRILGSWVDSHSRVAEITETVPYLAGVLKEIPEIYRDALAARVITSGDTEAAAAELGISVGAYKTRCNRARQMALRIVGGAP
jgi:DNA-directed RNA polymerase specialized sigma24 family protein